MAILRTTVILKTDIVDSTPRIAALTQAEMGLQRRQHKQFISEIAIKNLGSIFQDEGDAYWMEFPSVTSAALAAIEMHQDLRSRQAGKGEKQRLSIRAIITVGDILHQEGGTVGTTMSLTTRIEKVTPPDEIYLSHAAWLILNKAEVHTAYVGEFNLKGFPEPENIYKVDQKHRTRVITDQYIVFTDLRGWSPYIKSKATDSVERVLVDYDDILNEVCDTYSGIIRNTGGDQYFLTFSDVEQLFPAIDHLYESWKRMIERYHIGLSVAIHKGNLNIIRSYLYSNDINTTILLERLNSLTHPNRETRSIVVSGIVRDNAKGTRWERRFQEFEPSKLTVEGFEEIIREYGAHWFVVENTA